VFFPKHFLTPIPLPGPILDHFGSFLHVFLPGSLKARTILQHPEQTLDDVFIYYHTRKQHLRMWLLL